MAAIIDKNAIPLIDVQKNGTLVGTQSAVNFIAGTNVTLTVVDNPSSGRVDVTVEASGSGGSSVPSDFQPPLVSGNYYGNWYPADAGVSTGDTLYCVPIWVSYDQTFTSASIFVSQEQPGALYRIGLYANGDNNRPGSLIADWGEIDCSTPGLKEVTVSQALSANTLYWGAVLGNTSDGVTASVIGSENYGDMGGRLGYVSEAELSSGNGNINNYRAQSYGALPDPFGTPDGADAFPGIFLKF